MPVEIDISKRYRKQVNAPRLQAAVSTVLDAEQVQGDVTVVITDDASIAELNQRYLGQDGATDVLSFPAQSETESDFVNPPGAALYLGDIVIAFPYAARQAENTARHVHDELDLLVVHGTLHLLGYDHAEPEQQAHMWARQDAILAALANNREA